MQPGDDDALTLVPDDADPGETLRLDDDGPPGEPVLAAPLEAALALGGVLGQGGMAVVREARQRVLGRTVAVKSAKEGDSGAAAGRLVTEARIIGALEHPGILPVHDILTDAGGLPHIVLKRVEGKAWSDVMDDPGALLRDFGASDALGWNLEVLDAVCNAVHFAHTHGVVHRDLKPENVMVGAFGQVYVLDWGIAVSVGDDPRFPRAADQRRVVGTPRYMAPEMVGGDGRRVSARTDVYLLGAVLYRILAGRAPHSGLGVRSILAGIPAFVPDLSGAPAELASLVGDAMAADPERRPASAEEFRRRIRAFVEHRGASVLAASAERGLDELLALLGDPDADRVRVYDRFGAVRFGFQEALGIWPDHPGARPGLERAATALAAWELDQGDDRAADVLLALLSDVPPAIRARVDAVREDRLATVRRAERAQLDRNQRVGQGVRAGLAALFTVLWTVTPILGLAETGTGALLVGVAWLVVAAVALALYRDKWLATRMNRSILVLLGSALFGQVAVGLGQLTGTLDIRPASNAVWILNASFCVAAGFQIHRGFWLPAAVATACFLVVPWTEDWRPWLAALQNFLIGFVGVVMWWPRTTARAQRP